MTLRPFTSRHRAFAGAIIAAALIFVVAGTAAVVLRSRHVRAERELRGRRTELAKLQALNQSSDAAGSADLGARIAAAEDELARRGAAWKTAEATASAPTPADPLLELAEFAARLRTQARVAGVVVSPSERFGFAEFAHEAPPTADVATVRRQRALVEDVLARVFAAGAKELIAVQRSARTGPDQFARSPGTSFAQPGFVEATAVRVTFTGNTESLRTTLNSLAARDARALVVSVEVRSTNERGEADRRQRSFALTVERLEYVGRVIAQFPPDPREDETALRWKRNESTAALFGEPRQVGADVARAAGESSAATFPLRLVRVEPRRTRIELLGASEVDGRTRAILRERETGVISLLAVGDKCAQLEVELVEFAVAPPGDSAAPRLLLRDLRGGEIRLGESSDALGGSWQAVVSCSASDPAVAPRERIVAPGEQVRGGEIEYRVAAISARPPSVELTALGSELSPTETVRLEITP